MPKVIRNMVQHDFYCIKCGKRNYTLLRKIGQLKEKFHRKVLYCPTCGLDLNHVECRNDEEAFDFKDAFEKGEFLEEVNQEYEFLTEQNKMYKI